MDGLCLNTAIHAVKPKISVNGGLDVRTNPAQVRAVEKSVVSAPRPKKLASSASRFSFTSRLRGLWPRSGGGNILVLDDAVLVENSEGKGTEEGDDAAMGAKDGKMESWVLKILHYRSMWNEEKREKGVEEEKEGDDQRSGLDENGKVDCDFCRVDDDDESGIEFDEDSFSRLLRRVSLAEAKLYAQLSYLGNLAYSIPRIQPMNLLRTQGLRFASSSIEKKELTVKSDREHVPAKTDEAETTENDDVEGGHKTMGYPICASAASYRHSETKSILPFNSSKSETSEESYEEDGGLSLMNSEMASLMATTDSVTAVVAAKEEVKQAVADDLNSTLSSPCEWFICDDDQSGTRFFVIQGSESLASWQANLLFEPIEFEELDVLVHRGIYEAAKEMYKKMLPEVRSHLECHGRRALFRFTGHSLGGSLSLLVNLMLLVRGEVPHCSLLPVIMFGSPSIMCGGDHLLQKLGLPKSHIQAIMMHRDIVPRAFSCNYPAHIAKLLKAVNRNFGNHPCLNNQKLLYAPMGELLILQPDEKYSPHHHLLPSGSGLYRLSYPTSDTSNAEKKLQAAKLVFLNSPHPLEILSDRSAYGSEGTIHRDHDMQSYVNSIRNVIRQEVNQIRKNRREDRRKIWWRVVTPSVGNEGFVIGKTVSISFGQNHLNLIGMLKTERIGEKIQWLCCIPRHAFAGCVIVTCTIITPRCLQHIQLFSLNESSGCCNSRGGGIYPGRTGVLDYCLFISGLQWAYSSNPNRILT